jgi:iron(III) transport system ATP-binding protein
MTAQSSPDGKTPRAPRGAGDGQTSASSALSVAAVTKSYGDTQVLRGVSLSVEVGSLTAILGASGAGKTTLLRIIAGFELADSGTVELDGLVVDGPRLRGRVPPERRHIGYVPQDGGLFPHLTVRGNVAFGLPRRERHGSRVDELLTLVGLDGLGGRYPHELSGGQQQRVAIARALAVRPSLVLLDEPFAALDAGLRAAVRADVLGALRAVGATGILVTHDQDEALSSADYVAVLRDGVITQSGPPRSVYSEPADPWTAGFLGTANLLPGTTAPGPSGEPGVRTALGWHELAESGQFSFGGVAPKAPHGGGPGEVTVLIRPEQVVLAQVSGKSATGQAAAGQLTGKVTEVRYHGHDTLVTVDAEQAGPVRVRELGTEPPEPGDEVVLAVRGPVTAWSVPEGNF